MPDYGAIFKDASDLKDKDIQEILGRNSNIFQFGKDSHSGICFFGKFCGIFLPFHVTSEPNTNNFCFMNLGNWGFLDL